MEKDFLLGLGSTFQMVATIALNMYASLRETFEYGGLRPLQSRHGRVNEEEV